MPTSNSIVACLDLPARLVSQALHASRVANQNLGFALGDYAPGANFNLVLISEIVYNLFNQAAVLWRVEPAKKIFTFCFGDYHFGSKPGPGPFAIFWQLQFGCEIAILAPNLDPCLLELSGNYNLAVKLPLWLQIWTWAFWSLLAITIWL